MGCVPFARIIGGNVPDLVSFPLGSDLFKAPGSGLNYVHGGCSPVGMKKQFPTVFHETVNGLETVTVSAGKIGHQVQVRPGDLLALLGAKTADVIV